jgi:hypothetical protein
MTSTVPVCVALHDALDTYGRVSQQLFATLQSSRSAAQGPAATELLETLARLDADLGGLLDRAAQQAATQAKIDDLLARIRAYDRSWREDVREAAKWKKVLDAAVEEGQRDRAHIEGAAKGAPDHAPARRPLNPQSAAELDPAAILAYARRLAAFTSAPPLAKNRKLGEPGGLDLRALAQLPGARLPYPTEDMMKRGRLGMADSLVTDAGGVGETRDAMGGTWYPRRRLFPFAKAEQCPLPTGRSTAHVLCRRRRPLDRRRPPRERRWTMKMLSRSISRWWSLVRYSTQYGFRTLVQSIPI